MMNKKFLALVMLSLSLGACDVFPPGAGPRAVGETKDATENIRFYCDTAHATGGKSEAMHKNEGKLTERVVFYGVPTAIRTANHAYFAGFEQKTTLILAREYATIIESCRETGWKTPDERKLQHS